MGSDDRGRVKSTGGDIKIMYEKRIKFKLSRNGVYHTACSLLVILKNSCSRLYYQKGFNLILFSYKISLAFWQ